MDETNRLVHEADDAINFYLSQMRDIRMDDISSTNNSTNNASNDARIASVSTDVQLDAQPSTSRCIPISPLIDEELSPTFTGKTFFKKIRHDGHDSDIVT